MKTHKIFEEIDQADNFFFNSFSVFFVELKVFLKIIYTLGTRNFTGKTMLCLSKIIKCTGKDRTLH